MATTKKKVTDYLNPVDIGQTAPVAPKPDPIQKSINTPAPVNKDKTSNSLNDGVPKVIHDQDTGAISGVIINGKTRLGLNAKEVQFLVNKHYSKTANPEGTVSAGEIPISREQQVLDAERQRLADEALRATLQPQEQARITPEQARNLSTLTPEQQAVAQGNADVGSDFNIKQVAASALEKGATGAIGGVTAGGIIGNVPGAIIGGVGGLLGGIGYGVFASIKETTADDVAGIDRNVANAKYNLNSAVRKANAGAPYEEVKQAIGDSIAALDLAERQYKEQSKSLFDKKSIKKMSDLQKYKEKVMPGVINNAEMALLKPNRNAQYLDNGVDENGDAIGGD